MEQGKVASVPLVFRFLLLDDSIFIHFHVFSNMNEGLLTVSDLGLEEIRL